MLFECLKLAKWLSVCLMTPKEKGYHSLSFHFPALFSYLICTFMQTLLFYSSVAWQVLSVLEIHQPYLGSSLFLWFKIALVCGTWTFCCILWYNVLKSTNVEADSQNESNNQIQFSFASRHARKANRMNYMSESKFYQYQIILGWHFDLASLWLVSPQTQLTLMDHLTQSTEAYAFCDVPELIPPASMLLY